MGVEAFMEFNAGQKTTSTPGSAPQAAPRFGGGNGGFGNVAMRGGGAGKWITLVITVVIVLALVLLAAWGWKYMASADRQIKGNQYQALFLTNGQVYFGKLADVSGEYVRVTDIYYLQVQQTVQPEQTQPGASNNNQEPQVSLVKLGDELHGPEDEMMVNREQVLFWENLKDNGKVVEAINQHKNQN